MNYVQKISVVLCKNCLLLKLKIKCVKQCTSTGWEKTRAKLSLPWWRLNTCRDIVAPEKKRMIEDRHKGLWHTIDVCPNARSVMWNPETTWVLFTHSGKSKTTVHNSEIATHHDGIFTLLWTSLEGTSFTVRTELDRVKWVLILANATVSHYAGTYDDQSSYGLPSTKQETGDRTMSLVESRKMDWTILGEDVLSTPNFIN